MVSFEHVHTIFFDYDGTLHDSIRIYAPAFRKAYQYLVKAGYAEDRKWMDSEISYWLGYNSQDMWKNFMPNLSEEIKQKCSNIIGEEMTSLIEQGKPVLYNGAINTLDYLKNKGYRLIFISNCKTYYKEAHNRLFHLDKYFDSLICSEEYDFIPKYEIVRRIKERYTDEMVMIGDRMQDIDAGKKNKMYTVGCSYGYALEGELDTADILIHNIDDLKRYFNFIRM